MHSTKELVEILQEFQAGKILIYEALVKAYDVGFEVGKDKGYEEGRESGEEYGRIVAEEAEEQRNCE